MDRKHVVTAAVFLALLAAVAPYASAKTVTTHTQTLNYAITYASQSGTLSLLDNPSGSDIKITGGGLTDTLSITPRTKKTPASTIQDPATVSTDASLAKMTFTGNTPDLAATLRSVVAVGQIKKLTTTNASIDSVEASEVGNIAMTSKPNSTGATPQIRHTVINAKGSGGGVGVSRPLAATIKLSGVVLTNLSASDQMVNLISVSAKKNSTGKGTSKVEFISDAGIGVAPRGLLPTETLYSHDVIAEAIKKISVTNCSVDADAINCDTGDTPLPTAMVTGSGSLLTTGKGTAKLLFPRPANLIAKSLLTNAGALTVDAKGGNVNILDVNADKIIKKVSATYKTYKDTGASTPGLQVIGGIVGSETAYYFFPTQFEWPGQMLISSGGEPSPHPVLAATPKPNDIALVHGDLGVFAGMYADVNATSPTAFSIDASVKQISVKPSIPKSLNGIKQAWWQTVQGFGFSKNVIKPTSKKLPFDDTRFKQVH